MINENLMIVAILRTENCNEYIKVSVCRKLQNLRIKSFTDNTGKINENRSTFPKNIFELNNLFFQKLLFNIYQKCENFP